MSLKELASQQLYSFAETMQRLGVKSRTTIYGLIGPGPDDLKAVKLNGSTKITGPSIDRKIASLPPARVRAALAASRPASGDAAPGASISNRQSGGKERKAGSPSRPVHDVQTKRGRRQPARA